MMEGQTLNVLLKVMHRSLWISSLQTIISYESIGDI